MTSHSGYIDSEDSSPTHAQQLARVIAGTGDTFNAWPDGVVLVGTTEVPVDGGFFPNGNYTVDVGYLEFDTTAFGVGGATLTLTPNSSANQQSWNLKFAPYDWGATLTTDDWLTPTQLLALTVCGSASGNAIDAAFTGSGTVDITLAASGINAGGLTRLVAFSDVYSSGIPSGQSNAIFDQVIDANLVSTGPAPLSGTFTYNPRVIYDVPPTDAKEQGLPFRLMRHYNTRPEGINVWRLADGSFTTAQPYPTVSVEDAHHENVAGTYVDVFYGGHVYPNVNAVDAQALVDANLATVGVELVQN